MPEGESDADNQEVKRWGTTPEFAFPVRDHVDLMSRAEEEMMLALVLLIMAFVLILFMLAGTLERRLLRWRYR